MLIFSMGVSVDGYIYDRDGNFDWTEPSEELFAFHLQKTGELGAHLCGRRLWETMLVWENDPSVCATPDETAFAQMWTALPKVVFSRTLTEVTGNARLATSSLPDVLDELRGVIDKDVAIGGADLAASAIEQDLVDQYDVFRYPVVVGGGTSYFPAVTSDRSLELRETRQFPHGVVFESYVRRR